MKIEGEICCIEATESQLMIGCKDKIYILNQKQKEEERVLCMKHKRISTMNAMERLIVSGHEDGSIAVWDVFHNSPIKVIENEH